MQMKRVRLERCNPLTPGGQMQEISVNFLGHIHSLGVRSRRTTEGFRRATTKCVPGMMMEWSETAAVSHLNTLSDAQHPFSADSVAGPYSIFAQPQMRHFPCQEQFSTMNP